MMVDIPINSILIEHYGACQEETIRVYQYRTEKYIYIVRKKRVDALLFDDMSAELRKHYERFRAKAYAATKPKELIRAPITMRYPSTKKR
jgi:hypothetical protein